MVLSMEIDYSRSSSARFSTTRHQAAIWRSALPSYINMTLTIWILLAYDHLEFQLSHWLYMGIPASNHTAGANCCLGPVRCAVNFTRRIDHGSCGDKCRDVCFKPKFWKEGRYLVALPSIIRQFQIVWNSQLWKSFYHARICNTIFLLC